MTIRVAIIADSHFDTSSRWEECLKIHNWIAEDIKKRDVHLLLHAGDVFERKSNPTERNAVAEWLTKVAEDCPVVIVRGNHDVVGDLEIFSRLETEWPITVEEMAGVVKVTPARIEHRLVAIANVAWPRKAELLARVGVEGSNEQTQEVAQDMLRSVIRGLGVQMADFDGPKLINMHAMVDGCVTSAGQPLVGCDMNIGLADLGLAGADFYALGHIHCPQDWTYNGAPIVYPGSPRRTAYGETEEKGYILVEFEPALKGLGLLINGDQTTTLDLSKGSPCWTAKWQRIPTPCAPMLLFEAEWISGQFVMPTADDYLRAARESKGAEIRFRYRVPSDHRDAAKSLALGVRDAMLAAGAVDVKIEEQVIATTRARTPEIQQALTLRDKLPILWKSRDDIPSPERQAALFSKLEELETAARNAGVSTGTARGSLRLKSIRGKGFIPYPELFEVDFEKLGRLTAIVGGNGSGKSTMVELIGGSLVPLHTRFLNTPTRGPVKDITVARDAFFEVHFDRGGDYILRHNIDGFNGKVASSVTLEGKALLEKAQVSEYLTWAGANLPAPSVFYNTILRPQKSEGLVGMSASDRKALILRVLDLEYIEDLAARASSRQQQAMRSVDTVRGQLTELGASDYLATELEARLREAVEASEAATKDLEAKEADLALAKRDAEVVAKAISAHQQAFRERAALVAERTKLEAKQADLAERLRNNNAVLGNEAEINAAVSEHWNNKPLHQAASAEIAALEKTQAVLDGKFAVLRQREMSLGQQRDESKRVLDEARAVLARKDEIELAAANLATREAMLTESEGLRSKLRQEFDQLQSAALSTADGRVIFLRGELTYIAEGNAANEVEYAASALHADELAAREVDERPAAICAKGKELAYVETQVRTLQRDIGGVRTVAALLPEIKKCERVVTEERARLDTITTTRSELQKEMDVVNGFIADNLTAQARARAEVKRLQDRADELKPLVDRAEALAQAKTRIAEIERQQQELAGEMETVMLSLAGMPELGEEPKPLDVTTFEVAVGIVRQTLTTAQTNVALAEQALKDAQAKEARRQELAAQVKEYEANVADWTRLAMGLGKDGIQALEIGAAGPEITVLANDLLRSCGDTLFSVSVETSKMDSKGKKEIEGCPIWVYNSVKGTTQEANTLSGGEEVFVGEALSLALTMVGCQRSGVTSPVVLRDETSAALDPSRGPQYVAMMRRAAELLDAKFVFVSHAPDLQALADSTITINQGQVTVS